MAKSKVYTRSGDNGETSLVSGSRIPKSDLRIELYGEVDELNSWIGLIQAQCNQNEKVNSLYKEVQISLFNLGSRLACEDEFWDKYKLPHISEDLIRKLEANIDELDAKLNPLKSFILPGGTPEAATIHVVRTRCRKVERLLVLFNENGNKIPEYSLGLLNRLSDHLFVYARYINMQNSQSEELWQPNN